MDEENSEAYSRVRDFLGATALGRAWREMKFEELHQEAARSIRARVSGLERRLGAG